MRRQTIRKRLINVNIRGIFIRMLHSAIIEILLHLDSYLVMRPNKDFPFGLKAFSMRKILSSIMVGILSTSPVMGQDSSILPEGGGFFCHIDTCQEKTTYVQLKTNILYDALVVPNLSAEISLNKSWTIEVGYWYTWWKNDTSHKYWRGYGEEIDVRKYLGKHDSKVPFSGHHVGATFQMCLYDIEFGNRGYMSDFSYGIGAEYGYSVPLSSKARIDFAIAVGYFGGRYRVYDPMDSHYVWKENRNLHWVGPVKAGISFAYILNKKHKKGGKQ